MKTTCKILDNEWISVKLVDEDEEIRYECITKLTLDETYELHAYASLVAGYDEVSEVGN